MVLSADILVVMTGVEPTAGIKQIETKGAAKHPIVTQDINPLHLPPPTIKNAVQTINSADVEKPSVQKWYLASSRDL